MLDITQFNALIDKALEDKAKDMDWLAKEVGVDKAVLSMVLSRKTMKNITATIKKVSEVTGVEVPKMKDESEVVADMSLPKKGEAKFTEDISKPLITDDDPALEMNVKEIWVDGKRYTEQSIRKMVEAGVTEHRELIELDEAFEEACNTIKGLEAINADLITKAQELKDKYEDRDKDAIKLQVEAEELREQLAEKKEKNSLLNMTIEEGISQFRALKKLFKDEVLQ